MIKRAGQALLFFSIFFFYLWTASIEYGFFLGLHLTCLAFSFFVLFTPIASYFYLFGCLPGALSDKPKLSGVFFIWGLLLLINILTIYWMPGIYNKSPFYRAIYSVLLTYPINIFTLGFSGGTLLYHWSVSKIEVGSLKRALHLLGMVFSMATTHFVISRNHATLVFYLFNMSDSNY